MAKPSAPKTSSTQSDVDTEPMPIEEKPSKSRFAGARTHATGFAKSHFDKPESGEVYGVGRNLDSARGQVNQEKAAAAQAIWITGVLLVLLALGVWVLQ